MGKWVDDWTREWADPGAKTQEKIEYRDLGTRLNKWEGLYECKMLCEPGPELSHAQLPLPARVSLLTTDKGVSGG